MTFSSFLCVCLGFAELLRYNICSFHQNGNVFLAIISSNIFVTPLPTFMSLQTGAQAA